MWNFLVSALPIGLTIVLFDGSPLKDPAFLWNLTDELKITIFGTRSAAHVAIVYPTTKKFNAVQNILSSWRSEFLYTIHVTEPFL